VGVDARDAEVIADLGTEAGRRAMVDGVRAQVDDALDAIVLSAGRGHLSSTAESIVQVNYFGAIAPLVALQPLLARGDSPAAVVIASTGIVSDIVDSGIVDACLEDDEVAAVSMAASAGATAYASTKRALARWVRQNAATPPWSGAGIALNAVAPGVVETPMTEKLTNDELVAIASAQPFGGVGKPADVGSLVAWLAGSDNRFVTGQVIFVDGGYECVLRGDDMW